MKKVLYICVVAALPGIIYAQPVMHNMLEYIAGNSVKYYNCNPDFIYPGPSGANVMWSFNTVQTTDTIKQYIMDPSATPYASLFPLAAFAVKTYDGIVHHPTYDFIKRNIFTGHVDKQLLGSVDSFNSFTANYPDNVLKAHTPFTYMDSVTDDYTVSYANVSGAGHEVIKADGYGTLQLPASTHGNVLRIKTTYVEMDTTFGGPSFSVTHLASTRYEWYDDLHRSPLLTWDSTSITSLGGSSENKSLFYLGQENTTGVAHPGKRTLQVAASLHNNVLVINGPLDQGKEYFVELHASDGRHIFQTSFVATGSHWETALAKALADGIYVLNVTDRENNISVVKLLQN